MPRLNRDTTVMPQLLKLGNLSVGAVHHAEADNVRQLIGTLNEIATVSADLCEQLIDQHFPEWWTDAPEPTAPR